MLVLHREAMGLSASPCSARKEARDPAAEPHRGESSPGLSLQFRPQPLRHLRSHIVEPSIHRASPIEAVYGPFGALYAVLDGVGESYARGVAAGSHNCDGQ